MNKFLTAILLSVFLVCTPVQAAGLVNMNVTDAEVRDVLKALSAVGGTDIMISSKDMEKNKVTLEMNNIPFEEALDLVTKVTGLAYHKVGNVIVVTDSANLSRKFGDLHIFKLNHIDAGNVLSVLTYALNPEMKPVEPSATVAIDKSLTQGKSVTDGGGSSSSGGSDDKAGKVSSQVDFSPWMRQYFAGNSRIQIDGATNSIIFYGTPAEADKVRDILAELDVPAKQIVLEAQIVSLDKDASEDLGVEWTWDVSRRGGGATNYSGAYRVGKTFDFNFQPKINALVKKGNAKILARPNVKTINGKPARIFIGDQLPIKVTTNEGGVATTSIEYRDVGIVLNYLPQVHSDGQITAKVYTGVSTPEKDTVVPEAYQIHTRWTETETRMKDGETMVIGGLIHRADIHKLMKIPFLGDIPFFGKLFQSKSVTNETTEVVIMLTARVVNPDEPAVIKTELK